MIDYFILYINLYFYIYLRQCILETKNQLLKFNLLTLKHPSISNSLEIENHISWNYAEGVHLPYSSQQEVSFIINYILIILIILIILLIIFIFILGINLF